MCILFNTLYNFCLMNATVYAIWESFNGSKILTIWISPVAMFPCSLAADSLATSDFREIQISLQTLYILAKTMFLFMQFLLYIIGFCLLPWRVLQCIKSTVAVPFLDSIMIVFIFRLYTSWQRASFLFCIFFDLFSIAGFSLMPWKGSPMC